MANGGVAQLGERLPCKQEVTSSNLVVSSVSTGDMLESPQIIVDFFFFFINIML